MKAHCATCACVAACKHTFGAYWDAKSGGGEGCHYPLAPEHARAVEREMAKARAVEREMAKARAVAAAQVVQDELMAAKAEGESALAPRVWAVTHLRREYETTARTAAQAINNIRFVLYRNRPAASLPPFHAEPKRTGNISISSAARRLAALAQNRT
ncbi:MAG: hypothetical protein IIY62_00495 [Kiritimatiellae bacterium]|nr:hypothetical protein [Kiritimatiellia bacterium]